MFGQFCVVPCAAAPLEPEPLEDDAPDDALAEGLAVAACAIAAPPPTRAPESARATIALLIACRMSLTSSRSSGAKSSVAGWEASRERLGSPCVSMDLSGGDPYR